MRARGRQYGLRDTQYSLLSSVVKLGPVRSVDLVTAMTWRDKRLEAQRRWRVAQESLNQRLGVRRVVALHALLDGCQDLLADVPEGGLDE